LELILDVPDQCLADYEPIELARRIKLYAALFMFQVHEISAGAATELAGIDRRAFALECQRFDIPLLDYPAEDLNSELSALRAAT
jgi:predicted HTH domain antitoxin